MTAARWIGACYDWLVPPKLSPRSFVPRKLLVAALGVATINYVAGVACGGATDGNGSTSGDYPPTSGNLPAPQDRDQYVPPPTSGNLPAPPPFDAGLDADAGGDGGDGGGQDGGDGG